MKTVFMPKDLFDKWIAALRSGEYKQGRELLQRVQNNEIRYCCLGVLEDTAGEVEDVSLPSMSWLERHGIKFLDAYFAPTNDPYLEAFGQGASGANDKGEIFAEIADALEAAYGGETPP